MLKTLLLTGAAGGVGQALRPLLSQIAEKVVLSDLAPIDGERRTHWRESSPGTSHQDAPPRRTTMLHA